MNEDNRAWLVMTNYGKPNRLHYCEDIKMVRTMTNLTDDKQIIGTQLQSVRRMVVGEHIKFNSYGKTETDVICVLPRLTEYDLEDEEG